MDREKVIEDNAVRGLQSAIEISGALVHLRREHAKAILALLKSQQAEIERLQPKTVNPVKPLDVDDDYTYLCDSCKGELFCGDVLRDHFCPSCGGKVAWKDGDGDVRNV